MLRIPQGLIFCIFFQNHVYYFCIFAVMKKVAVVILNYNGKKFLEKFLPTVIEHSSDVADIVVADNASTDDSVAFMREAFPENIL